MKKTFSKTIIAIFSLLLLTSLTQAKECYNANTIDVKWTSYKTMAKIGVGGNFSKTNLQLAHKNNPSIQKLLNGAKVTLNLTSIDAHLALKNSNIADFFTANLSTDEIHTKVIYINEKSLNLQVTLNGITQIIPMKYTSKNSHIMASGVIDALDFHLVPSLRVLNKNVSGHKNKGWNDISISFDMPYTTTCK